MSEFSHVDQNNRASMVDVGAKVESRRKAIARAIVSLPEHVAEKLSRDGYQTPKGPVFEVARIAGIMGAKKTGELIPLCHPLGVDVVEIDIQLVGCDVIIFCTAAVTAKTGVEMEALTGASVAALTIYDMCKALSHELVISKVELIEKTGGKSDYRKEA